MIKNISARQQLTPLCIGVIAGFITVKMLAKLIEAPEQTVFESDRWTSEAFPTDLRNATASWNAGIPSAALPDRHLTPGSYFKEVTLEMVKQPNFQKTIRNVSWETRKQVAASYGVTMEEAESGEFDHLVPASLGGNSSPENIWWQPGPTGKNAQKWNYKLKDRLEKHVLKEVREGNLNLDNSRERFAEDWIKFYLDVLGEPDELTAEELKAEPNE